MSYGKRVAAAAALLAATACTSPPETKYYSLGKAAPLEERAASAGPVVLVDRFVVDDAYADERLAYRQGEHELGFDPYVRWAGAPSTQVENAVRDLLRSSGLFSAVRQPSPIGTGRSGYDLVVTGRLSRLEEVDGEDEWGAALDLELILLDGKTRDVLCSKRFAASSKAAKRNPREVVAALSRMLEDAVREFLAAARPSLRSRESAPPAPPR